MNISGAVLLGNTEKPRKRLMVPKGLEDDRPPLVGHCLVPGCGAKFYRGEEADYQRHAEYHVKHDLDDLRALAPSETKRGTVFDPADVDPEVRAHWRKVRADMEREGRTEVRPNETAERGS
jgi:hypothetical protein